MEESDICCKVIEISWKGFPTDKIKIQENSRNPKLVKHDSNDTMFGRYLRYSDEDGTMFYEQKERIFNFMHKSQFPSPFFIRREKSGFVVSNNEDGNAAWVRFFGKSNI